MADPHADLAEHEPLSPDALTVGDVSVTVVCWSNRPSVAGSATVPATATATAPVTALPHAVACVAAAIRIDVSDDETEVSPPHEAAPRPRPSAVAREQKCKAYPDGIAERVCTRRRRTAPRSVDKPRKDTR